MYKRKKYFLISHSSDDDDRWSFRSVVVRSCLTTKSIGLITCHITMIFFAFKHTWEIECMGETERERDQSAGWYNRNTWKKNSYAHTLVRPNRKIIVCLTFIQIGIVCTYNLIGSNGTDCKHISTSCKLWFSNTIPVVYFQICMHAKAARSARKNRILLSHWGFSIFCDSALTIGIPTIAHLIKWKSDSDNKTFAH